jgi:predicted DsbA family dithiol-disulfide isomerase
VEIALELGLDLDRLEKDMQDLLLVVRINQDIRHGVKAGVRGTPTVLINGRFSKARTLEELQAAVEKELERVKKDRVVKSGRDCEASKRQP